MIRVNRDVKRRACVGNRVHVGATQNQLFEHGTVTPKRCFRKRCSAAMFVRVYVSALIEKVLHGI